MQATVIGTRIVDFKTKDGKHIQGTSVYIAYAENGVVGKAAERIFVAQEIDLPKGMAVGSKIQLFFDRKGKVQAVVAAAA